MNNHVSTRADLLPMRTAGGWSLLLAAALHGPLDVAVTSMYWHLESNPVVIDLGLWPWVAVKGLALVGLAAAWALSRGHWASAWLVRAVAVAGVLLIVPNLWIAGVVA